MKTTPLLIIFTFMVLVLNSPAQEEKLAPANTAFAFDLMNQIVQGHPEANIFISPFSVSTALQLVNNGAWGQTKSEIQQVLKIDSLPPGAINPAFAAINGQLMARKDVTLNLANGLWYQNGFHLKPTFTADNQKYFQAELSAVDFGNPQSADAINNWADKQTKGKIQKVVQFPFPPATRLILANAIYFKGKWVEPFKKRLTAPRAFYLAHQMKLTPMMTQAGNFSYLETPDFQAVCLPYKGGLQMQLFLPRASSNPQALLAKFMAGDTWEKDVRLHFVARDGSVTLPKFKMEYEVRLNDPLMALGMKTAFSPNANFSGIASEPTFISEVRQKSYVDVNEEGTEAAAVTTTMVTASLAHMPTDRFTMILDHPFFFVISDIGTGSILFMGVVNNPTVE